jgi:hypothetical protein
MGLLINRIDFAAGRYEIAQNTYTNNLIDAYILKYEEPYLIDLLGVTLFDLFKADVTAGAPGSPIYLAIFNPIREDYSREIKISEGMKIMLLGFVYFHIMRDMKFKSTLNGVVENQTEVSKQVTLTQTNLHSRFNESVFSYEVIQWYIEQNKTDYPDYNGQCKDVVSQW